MSPEQRGLTLDLKEAESTLAQVIQFPRLREADARPPRRVRLAVLVVSVALATGALFWLLTRWSMGATAAVPPAALLAISIWVAWYSVRCRFEVSEDGVRFRGFLPSRLVRLEDLEEVTVVRAPVADGRRFDRSHLRLRRRGGGGAFKLSLSWDGADDVVRVLERLVPDQFRTLEAS